jgi:hypothetical protein
MLGRLGVVSWFMFPSRNITLEHALQIFDRKEETRLRSIEKAKREVRWVFNALMR